MSLGCVAHARRFRRRDAAALILWVASCNGFVQLPPRRRTSSKIVAGSEIRRGGSSHRTQRFDERRLYSSHEAQNDAKSTSAVLDVLKRTVSQLEDANIDEPLESALHLTALAMDLPWETGYGTLRQLWRNGHQRAAEDLLPATQLTEEQLKTLRGYTKRRLEHEPLQYIAGQWDFLDHVLTIRPPLLCPRPETEELVELVLEDLQEREQHDDLRILDVGCGTGCIGIALADRLPSARVTAIDVEPVAVEISRLNADKILAPTGSGRRYHVELCAAEDFVVVGNNDKKYDLVVSNPPYIPEADMEALSKSVKRHESWTALAAGADGMDVIRCIVRKLPFWCKPGATCWMEVDPSHPALLQEWLSNNNDGVPGVQFTSSYKDLCGRDRFVKLQTV